jgi:hypothetical protein
MSGDFSLKAIVLMVSGSPSKDSNLQGTFRDLAQSGNYLRKPPWTMMQMVAIRGIVPLKDHMGVGC